MRIGRLRIKKENLPPYAGARASEKRIACYSNDLYISLRIGSATAADVPAYRILLSEELLGKFAVHDRHSRQLLRIGGVEEIPVVEITAFEQRYAHCLPVSG